MNDMDPKKLSADEWDELKFPRPEVCDFDRVVESALSRRGFLKNVLVYGSGAAVMGSSFLKGDAAQAQTRFPFEPIPAYTDGTVHVPAGYKWDVLVRWGDPLTPEAEGDWNSETGGSVEMSDKVFGENTDGMELFNIGGREILCVNSEYTNREENLPQAPEGVPQSADDVLKLQNLQGVNIMEIEETDAGWRVVVDSPYNRRITHNTKMELTGPVAGHDLVKTAADPTGMTAMGTMNNCGSGKTPWGTYLTCEENWNGYFGSTDESFEFPADYARYGIDPEGWGYDYHKWDARFDVSQNPNEPRTQGYIVEIDPSDPSSMPKKRTALGRIKHENAECVVAPDGRVVVYSGDDERGEFMYKWVSRDAYVPGGDTETLLVEGTLFVAKFHDDGTGEWLALTPETTGMASAAEVALMTRTAASAVGATTMDRPEWIATNPIRAEGYCCLTNNTRRTVRPNAGGDPTPVNGPNPRPENQYGQIVRWRPHGANHASNTFDWDLYVMAGNPTVHDDAYGGSANMNEGNLFNSPDGLAIDSTGLVWIQTDGNYRNEGDFAGNGNNQQLAGDPVTGRIERFMTGPFGCEVTGLCWSSDLRTMFIGIQHPGAPFPDGEGELPRSAIVAVKREDNAIIG